MKEAVNKKQFELLNLLFNQSLAGIFFMMLDEPVLWNDSVDKEKVLDYVFEHQRITQVNQAMLEQYRVKEEDFLGSTPKLMFAHDLAQGRKVWKHFFDDGHLHIDTDEQRFDGTSMTVLGDYICLFDEDGRITGHFGIQIDMSDRKMAEEALARSEKRFNMALSGAEVGLWDWDLVNDKVYLSPMWKQLIGFKDDEIENSFFSWKSRIHPDDLKKVEQGIEDYLQGKIAKY